MATEEERIHKAHAINPALHRPLVFGDREQIRAVRNWENALQEFEEREEAFKGDGTLREYEIEYTIPSTRYATVVARSQAEAEHLLTEREQVDEIDHVTVGAVTAGKAEVRSADNPHPSR